MTTTERADAYLSIPASYGGSLGGLVWSSGCDAIERWNGTTLAFAEEIRDVLEGVFARPPVPPFGFVLALLRVVRDGPDTASIPLDRLWRAHTAAKSATGLARNTGLMIAELCRGLPAAAGAPEWAAVAAALSRRRLFGEHWSLAAEPPLPRDEFERRVEARLQKLDDAALVHWLTHGCDPSGAGEKLAEPVDSLPVRVAKLLALARRRPRLVGAAALAPALDAAITLPPRRRTPDVLPQGGYCDVTTRGEPDRLLPSQFALDRDEFVRRFAEWELLYFKREEPHAIEKPERVVVLDQGVRVWGSVRLALAAAALVLLKKDAKRVGRVRLAATSVPELIDITGPDPAELADLLEASDLTPHPGEALGRAILDGEAGTGPRDLILLTHPRAIREPDVTAAARDLRPADRLFTLSVDDRGRAELGEWTAAGPVTIRAFRVDLAAAEAARVEGEPAPPRPVRTDGAWTGDVEPIGFPFRPGLVSEPTLFGFDADGDWLVIAGRDGVLHGLGMDDAPPEVLPRPFFGGVVLRQVDAMLGVSGGVVVCGRMTPAEPGIPAFVAAHYDRATRRVAVHQLGPAADRARWSAYPDLHCVAVRVSGGRPGVSGCALDLATFGRFPGGEDAGLVSRARAAWDRTEKGGSPPYNLPVLTQWSVPMNAQTGPYLYLKENVVQVKRTDPEWSSFEPQRDGKPTLAGATIHAAQLAGDVLAVAMKSVGERKVVLFRGPDGAVIGELSHYPPGSAFGLSPDGRRVARRRGPREVAVTDTASLTPARPGVTLAGLHNALGVRWKVEHTPFQLTIWVGGFEHTFRVDDGLLVHVLARGLPGNQKDGKAGWVHHPPTEYDPARFPPREIAWRHGWRAVPDRLGQVLLYRATGELVASFLVRREKAAAWLPGGVFWGDSVLVGGPPTPDAAAKIGRAIATAGGQS